MSVERNSAKELTVLKRDCWPADCLRFFRVNECAFERHYFSRCAFWNCVFALKLCVLGETQKFGHNSRLALPERERAAFAFTAENGVAGEKQNLREFFDSEPAVRVIVRNRIKAFALALFHVSGVNCQPLLCVL